MTGHPRRRRCDLCGEIVASRPWILLNRYGLGTGTCRALVECVGIDGYVWEMGEDFADEDRASGTLLCWPACAHQWIEAKMVGVATEARQRGLTDP